MLRSRLALALALPTAAVTLYGAVAMHRAQAAMQRQLEQAAQIVEGLERYEQLSRLASRLVTQQLAALNANRSVDVAGQPLRGQIEAAVQSLRGFAARAAGGSSADHSVSMIVDLALTPPISAVLESVMYQLAQAERLYREERRGEASALVSQVLTEDIERRLDPLLSAAVAAQHERFVKLGEALSSSAQQMRLEFYGLLVVASALTAAVSYGVFRIIERPIDALSVGTKAISAGNLAWRIPTRGRGKLAELARHFNQMAGHLEQQHHALLEQQLGLETKVMERTRQLYDVNRELQRLDKLRRQFLADVGHELKTPLTVIRGEAEVTLRGKDTTGREYRECLERIGKLTVQLDRLVSDLLLLARAESGHLQFEFNALDAGDMAAQVVDDLRVLAHSKSIDVNHVGPDQPAWVRGDRSRLCQALLAIGDNACRYAPSGSAIDVSVRVLDTEVCFTVADHGIGIPPEDLVKIFDRYFRSANARSSSEDGTGLGLPVAQAIINAHGGRITVRSAPNTGTAFAVVLPRAVPDDVLHHGNASNAETG